MGISVAPDYEHNIVKALQLLIPECTFILHGRNGVEPESPYCLVSILSETKSGRSEKTNSSKIDPQTNMGWQTVSQNYLVNYTMTFHGTSKSQSEEWARYLSIAIESEFLLDIFHQYGMAVLDWSAFPRMITTTNNVVQYLNDTVDITILTNRSEDFPVHVIEEVNITGYYQPNDYQWSDDGSLESDNGKDYSNYIKREIKINGSR